MQAAQLRIIIIASSQCHYLLAAMPPQDVKSLVRVRINGTILHPAVLPTKKVGISLTAPTIAIAMLLPHRVRH